MEELMIKYLDGRCNNEEIALLKNNTPVWQELQQMQKMDKLFLDHIYEVPGSLLKERILLDIRLQGKEKSWDFRDFILPVIFTLGSLVYLFTGKLKTSGADLSWLQLPDGSQGTMVFLSTFCILALVLLDQVLQKKTGKTLHLFSLVA